MRRRHLLMLTTVVFALAVSGCGGDDDGTKSGAEGPGTRPSASTTSAAPRSTTSTTGSAIDALPGAATTPVSTPRTSAPTHLTALRVARQHGFDRVVFEFDAAAPGFTVAYADGPVTADGSGAPVAVAGGAALVVRMESASAVDLSSGDVRPTYTGPARLRASTPEVTEVVRTGDFEGVLTWAIGVKADRVDFRAQAMTSPGRVVVDIRNS